MRKLFVLTIIVLMTGLSAFAEPGAKKEARKAQRDSIKAAEMIGAHQKGTKIKLDGTVLTKEQQALLLSNIDGVDYNEDWAEFRGQRRLGNGLAIGGSVFVAAGAACEVVALGYVVVGALVAVFSFGQADMNEVMKPAGYFAAGGMASAAVGAGVMAIGIPIRVKADKKMKTTCEGYNNATERVSKELILGGTNSGVGIAFNF